MVRVIGASLRRRAGRAVALLLGVLVATTGFTVLTGSTGTARLQVTGTVQEHGRGGYDLLVRPTGSRSPVEAERGAVATGISDRQPGGITELQWRRIQQVAGVEVAAPVAPLGPAYATDWVEVDITEAVDPEAERQLIELRPRWVADRGLTELLGDPGAYVYVTRRPIAWPLERPVNAQWHETGEAPQTAPFSDGVERPLGRCGDEDGRWATVEIQADGGEVPVCVGTVGEDFHRSAAWHLAGPVVHLTEDGRFVQERRWDQDGSPPTDRLTVHINLTLTFPVVAIDPEQEAALVGLDQAVVAGHYLGPDEEVAGSALADDLSCVRPSGPIDIDEHPVDRVPVLAATAPVLDEQLVLEARQVRWDGDPMAGRHGAAVDLDLRRVPKGEVHRSDPVGVGDGYFADTLGDCGGIGMAHWAPSTPSLDEGPGGALVPRQPWDRPSDFDWPALVQDTGFREPFPEGWSPYYFPLGYSPGTGPTFTTTVGVFDPARLAGLDGLGRVPLATYDPWYPVGADGATRELLGDRPLLPNTNPAGYLLPPPAVLVPLDLVLARAVTLDSPSDPEPEPVRAPISLVRVRVAGVTGFDDVSRERVRVAAEEIATATGLEVEIVFGSSPAAQEVVLPAGEFGRPELRLAEDWSLKGVAAAVIEAVDRKSVVLFGLILVVCVLFMANATTAAVRDRRRELAVLACLGWSRWRLAATIAGEVTLVALVAGGLAAVAALPLGALAGVELSPIHAALAVPVALALALLASVVPALRASRTHPGSAVAPAVVSLRTRARHRRTVLGMALGNLGRVPGRTLLGVLALAVGVGGLTLLVAVVWVFHGTVTGSVLGDAVSVRVRGVDAVAVVATLLLGLVAVADVLYVNVRERASELAALRATGWSEAALGRLVTFEGLGVGALGGVLGAVVGLAGAAWFAGTLPVTLLGAAAGMAAAGVALAGLAALVPAALQRRVPVAALLAEE